MKAFRSLTDRDFEGLFKSFRRSAFRLETLQRYAVDYEEVPLRDFLAGRPRYTHPVQADYAALIRSHVAGGRSMSRVHIVTRPLSDYVRFEIAWPYADSVAAGEDVRLLPVGEGDWPEGLPREDFWLFDDVLAAVMRYDDDGRFTEAQLTDDAESVRRYVGWREAALRLSVSYEVFVTAQA